MVTLFLNADGVVLLDYTEHDSTMTGAYYADVITLCLKKTGPLLHFQITPTILFQYQQILV